MDRFASFLFAAVTLVCPPSANPQAIGTLIARPDGAWLVNGMAAIDGGAYRENTRIALSPAAARDARNASIQVIYSAPGTDPFTCRGSEACARGVCLASSGTPNGFVAKLISTGRLIRSGVLPDLAAARGIAQQFVDDGVVLRDGDRIVVGPLLGSVEPGSYRAEIAGGGAEVTVPVTVGPRSTADVSITVPGAANGLYTARLLASDGDNPLSEPATFLAVGAARFAGVRDEYRSAVGLTQSWSPTAQNQETAELFLRRVLHALATAP